VTQTEEYEKHKIHINRCCSDTYHWAYLCYRFWRFKLVKQRRKLSWHFRNDFTGHCHGNFSFGKEKITMHKQFDFWIGDWIVLDSLGNKVIKPLIC
jgi:hypothetical protein